MECVMEILDQSGHLTLSWNPEEPESVTKAREEFDRLRAAGYAFFSTPESMNQVSRIKAAAFQQPGSLDVRPVHVTEFQPRTRRQVAVRPMVGG